MRNPPVSVGDFTARGNRPTPEPLPSPAPDLRLWWCTLAHDGLARKFLTARERAAIAALDDDARRRAFLRLWTCKEAMSKATGEGLSAPFDTIGVDTAARLIVAEGSGRYAPAHWTLHPVSIDPELLGTVAIWRQIP